MRISDWSSDVCSADLGTCRIAAADAGPSQRHERAGRRRLRRRAGHGAGTDSDRHFAQRSGKRSPELEADDAGCAPARRQLQREPEFAARGRSEEHTSELQSLMRISYAVFCLKKKKTDTIHHATK